MAQIAKGSESVSGTSWLAKIRRYGGGESVISRHSTHLAAQEVVQDWNTRYQSDMAYVEKYDPMRAGFPMLQQVHSTAGRRIDSEFIRAGVGYDPDLGESLQDMSQVTWIGADADGAQFGHWGTTHS